MVETGVGKTEREVFKGGKCKRSKGERVNIQGGASETTGGLCNLRVGIWCGITGHTTSI